MERDNGISTWSLAAIVWAALVITFALINRECYFDGPFLETSDAAVNGIMVGHARHFEQIYGNYSRFAFNHPGPAFYYVYALGEWLLTDLTGVSPTPGNAHMATIMVVQSAFFAIAIAMFASWWRWRAWLPLAMVAAAVQFGPVRGAFVSTWPPDVLLMPSLAFLIACISVANGRLQHLVVMVLAGGFLFHGHVAQSMFVATLGPLALAVNLWRHRRANGSWAVRQWFAAHRVQWLAAAGLVGLFLLPLAIDLVCYGAKSNLATILARFRANTTDAKDPWQSLLYFFSFGTRTEDQKDLFTVIGPVTRAFFADNALRLALWGVVWAIPPIAIVACRRRFAPSDLRFLVTGWLFFVCAAALCVVWGMAQAREMWNFNGIFYYGVFYLAALLALAVISRAIDHWFPGPVTMVLVVGALAALGWNRFVPSVKGSGLQIQEAVATALAAENAPGPRFLSFEHGSWPIVAAVALELERRGVGFRVPPWWEFMFGREHGFEYPRDGHPLVWWITNPGDDGLALTPELSLFRMPAPIQPTGDEVRTKYPDNGFRYVVCGMTPAGNPQSSWSNLARVCFQFTTPRTTNDVRLVFDGGSAEVRNGALVPQPAEVFWNGESVGRVEFTVRGEVEVRVPAAVWNRAPTALLELHFPNSVPDPEPGRPAYEGRRACNLFAIRFRPVT